VLDERQKMSNTINEISSKLINWFSENSKKVIVALSGGVDSAVVALCAKEALGSGALAITANYKTLSEEELITARKVADEIGIEHKIIEYDELENSQFVNNDHLRCYYCRKELGLRLVREANKYKVKLIVDGTHKDDLGDNRPGIKALKENGIKSPLLEMGISKCEIRLIAKQYALSIFDKPSNSCLASRIPQGTRINYQRLKKIEISEMIVKNIFDVRQVRVRDHTDVARIEVGNDELYKLFDVAKLKMVDTKLKEQGFKFVSIDTKGYKSGNLTIIE